MDGKEKKDYTLEEVISTLDDVKKRQKSLIVAQGELKKKKNEFEAILKELISKAKEIKVIDCVENKKARDAMIGQGDIRVKLLIDGKEVEMDAKLHIEPERTEYIEIGEKRIYWKA